MAVPSYTYTPGSGLARDRIRLLIPDPVIDGVARFDDNEIADLYSLSGDVLTAVANACEIIGMDEARRAISVSFSSGMSVSRTNKPTFWLNRAKQIRDNIEKNVNKIPWESIDNCEYIVDFAGGESTDYFGDD